MFVTKESLRIITSNEILDKLKLFKSAKEATDYFDSMGIEYRHDPKTSTNSIFILIGKDKNKKINNIENYQYIEYSDGRILVPKNFRQTFKHKNTYEIKSTPETKELKTIADINNYLDELNIPIDYSADRYSDKVSILIDRKHKAQYNNSSDSNHKAITVYDSKLENITAYMYIPKDLCLMLKFTNTNNEVMYFDTFSDQIYNDVPSDDKIRDATLMERKLIIHATYKNWPVMYDIVHDDLTL